MNKSDILMDSILEKIDDEQVVRWVGELCDLADQNVDILRNKELIQNTPQAIIGLMITQFLLYMQAKDAWPYCEIVGFPERLSPEEILRMKDDFIKKISQ